MVFSPALTMAHLALTMAHFFLEVVVALFMGPVFLYFFQKFPNFSVQIYNLEFSFFP